MNNYDKIGLHEFLRSYPRMAVKPASSPELHIEGLFEFTGSSATNGSIADCYNLSVVVPSIFPRDLPIVEELDHKVPRNGAYHVNPGGSLCLGSRLRLLFELARKPTLVGFADNCLVPYLFGVSHKLRHGGKFPFGELPHGLPGELIDYMNLFGLRTQEQARIVLRYLAIKKRRANKLPCPCGCNRRLGACHFNRRVRQFRKLAERSWFRSLS